MQFDNIEYFAKTKQNTYGVHAYSCLREESSGLNTVYSFTARFSLLKCIKNDRKIQDMGAENL